MRMINKVLDRDSLKGHLNQMQAFKVALPKRSDLC